MPTTLLLQVFGLPIHLLVMYIAILNYFTIKSINTFFAVGIKMVTLVADYI